MGADLFFIGLKVSGESFQIGINQEGSVVLRYSLAMGKSISRKLFILCQKIVSSGKGTRDSKGLHRL